MRHYLTPRIRVVLVVAVLLAALLAVLSSLTGLNIGEVVVQGVLTPLRTGVVHAYDNVCHSLERSHAAGKDAGFVTERYQRRHFHAIHTYSPCYACP